MASVAGAASQTAGTSKRPIDSSFLQQKLPACKPLLTPGWVITIYMLVGVVFIPIGVFSLRASKSVVEIVYRYDTWCVPGNVADKVNFIQSNKNTGCVGHITVREKMDPPIYVYYELDNYYQNHRRYVKSRSDTQLLKGDKATDTKNCRPEQTLPNNSSCPIIPCGLIAWSFFNDTYNFTSGGKKLFVNKTGISWKSDREHKFGASVYPRNFPNNYENASWVLIGGAKLNTSQPLNKDEDLIVWMRTAALPNFRKLYGRIEGVLKVNTTIAVHINNVYNTYSFGGKKKLVLSTTSWLGGKNDFLGIAYITVGSICIFLALLFLAAYLKYPRLPGDIERLSWNRRNLSK